MPTRDDVAKLAGVSTATVSRVLNDSEIVSDDLRERVLSAAKKLHYQPNFVARSLATNQSFNVAITVNDISNPYYGEIIKGMKEVAVRYGYMPSIISPNDFEEQGKSFILHLIQRKVDGVLHLMSHTSFNAEDFVQMRTNGIALVNDPTNPRGSTITLDYQKGVGDLAKLFVEYGHSHLGILAWKTPAGFPTDSRLSIFRDTLHAAGITLPETQIFGGGKDFDTSQRNGYLAMMQLLEHQPRITGVFAMNDMMAYGAMKACHENGVRIPDDISIAGCDDVFLSECTSPPLTTVCVPTRELGKRSMELLIQRIQKDPAADRTIVIETSLVRRASVSSPR